MFLSLLVFISCSSDDNGGTEVPTGDIALNCSPEQIEVSAVGGNYTLNVSCSHGEWTAYADNDCSSWVTVKVSGSTNTQGTVTVTVAANKENDVRTSSIVLKAGTKNVTVPIKQNMPLQVGKATVYSISKGDVSLVEVKSTGNWTVKSNDSWIKAEVARGVTIGDITDADGVRIITEANTEMTPRTGTVDVVSGEEKITITVIQNSAEDANIDTPDGYHLVWHDEFNNGSTLSNDWTHEVQGPGWVNNELQTYVNGSADGKRVTELVDGRLHINCFKGSDGKIYSGRVYAKVREGWTYGYIEASIKLPKGKGTWPAFWMMPVGNDWSTNPWPMCGEIDIMEEVGVVPNEVSSSIHTQDYNHTKNTQKTHAMTIDKAEGEFHVYALEWTADAITTYVDGKVQLAVTKQQLGSGHNQWPFHYAFYPILNLAWGGSWGGMNGVDESALPVTMEVDYVRVFQKK